MMIVIATPLGNRETSGVSTVSEPDKWLGPPEALSQLSMTGSICIVPVTGSQQYGNTAGWTGWFNATPLHTI